MLRPRCVILALLSLLVGGALVELAAFGEHRWEAAAEQQMIYRVQNAVQGKLAKFTGEVEDQQRRLKQQISEMSRKLDADPPAAGFGNQSSPASQWGVVFPYHAQAGTGRHKLTEASWLSLCRAIREAQDLGTFHIMLIDDAGEMDVGYKRRQSGALNALGRPVSDPSCPV
jgi:hypothetical protein